MLLMIIQKSQSETHWACVPDPPVLHPAVWKGKDIAVTVNDSHLLDQPATQEFLNDWTFDVLMVEPTDLIHMEKRRGEREEGRRIRGSVGDNELINLQIHF